MKLWLARLEDKIKVNHTKNNNSAYHVSVADLMKHGGFEHLNTALSFEALFKE